QSAGPAAKAIYWAHNAHVTHPPGSTRSTGSLLRSALGCDYAAIALTFGSGGFVAQIPNDPEDRLSISNLPAAAPEAVESVLAEVGTNASLTTWPCGAKNSSPDRSEPIWLQKPHP